jgi:long-chain acyl-CoA synthetase
MGASTVLIPNPRDMVSLIKAIRDAEITMMVGLNTLFNGLLNHTTFKTVNFSRLKLTIAGGMAMQKSVADRWQNITGVTVLQVMD